MTDAPTPSQFWAKLKYKDDDRSTGEIVERRQTPFSRTVDPTSPGGFRISGCFFQHNRFGLALRQD